MYRSLTWANQLFNNGMKRSWLLCGERRISWSPSGPLARLALGTGYTRAQRTFTSGARIDRQTDRLLQRTKDISSAPTTTPPPHLQIAFQRTPKLGNTLISSPLCLAVKRCVYGQLVSYNRLWERGELFFQGSGAFLRFRGRQGFIK